MTNPNQILEQFNSTIAEYLPLIKAKLSELIGEELEIQPEPDSEIQLDAAFFEQNPVERCLHLHSGNYQHSWIFNTEFIETLRKWMLKEETEEEAQTESDQWLEETVRQVVDHVKQELPDIALTDMDLNDSPFPEGTDPEKFPETGLLVTYNIAKGDETLQLLHALRVEPGEDTEQVSNEATAPQDTNVHPVEFENFSGNGHHDAKTENINILMDVELEIQAELGRKQMLIKDILKLGKGSVVELDKAAGEALDIYVNGNKFAKGEVVVVDDQFGIRITQFQNYQESIKSMV
jgi:flagellar motor switch protein FliN